MIAPVFVDPHSLTGDEIAGETPDAVALNAAGSLRISLAFRCKPQRPAPDLRELFRGCRLSEAAKDSLRWVESVYARIPLRAPASGSEVARG